MTRAESNSSTPVCEADTQAITLLFKRIAERGHRLRNQNRSASPTETVEPTVFDVSRSEKQFTESGSE